MLSIGIDIFGKTLISVLKLFQGNGPYCVYTQKLNIFLLLQRHGLWKDATDLDADFDRAEDKVATPASTPAVVRQSMWQVHTPVCPRGPYCKSDVI